MLLATMTRRIMIFKIILISILAIATVVFIAIITLPRVMRNEHQMKPANASMQLPDRDWWKSSPIYQIYPRSFQDSNGDGTGDLVGIRNRIPYLRDLGIKAVWLSPIYQSPMADFGYDISNFTDIDPLFGTMDDFRDLVEELHKYGMHIIMDLVPNHTSDQHNWFQQSLLGKEPYRDYYVWRNQKNNWLSAFGNSSWQYSEIRKQYYLHQFLYQQPDLNYRNPAVRQEMLSNLQFWVDQGVDGFRIDAIIFLMEDALFRDEPRSDYNVPSNNHEYVKHIYTTDLPETYEVVAEWTNFFGNTDACIRNTFLRTPTCYYGDELGMINADISYKDAVDPAGTNWGPDAYLNFSRDPQRTPMQWDSSPNAGFSKADKPWLPLGPDSHAFNVEQELKDPNSHLNIFKALVKLRQDPAFRQRRSNLRLIDVENEDIFVFTRELDANYVIILNFGHDGKETSINYGLATGVGEIVLRSANAVFEVGDTIDFSKPLKMSNAEGYVVKLLS